jgi:hypothetical protein
VAVEGILSRGRVSWAEPRQKAPQRHMRYNRKNPADNLMTRRGILNDTRMLPGVLHQGNRGKGGWSEKRSGDLAD